MLRPPAAGLGSSGLLAPQSLAHQRVLVEQLDAQATFAYLLQNGALTEQDVGELASLGEQSRAQANIRLLHTLEVKGRHAQYLLVNALRQSGQHALANLLDEGIRIKKFTGSGYFSKKRRRGQVSVHIEVRAIKVPQSSVASFIKKPLASQETTDVAETAPQPAPESSPKVQPQEAVKPVSPVREWVSMDDVRMRIAQLSASIAEAQQLQASQSKLGSVQCVANTGLQMMETQEEEVEKPAKCCIIACLSSIFSSSKKKKTPHKTSSAKIIATSPNSFSTQLKTAVKNRSDLYIYSDTNGNGVHLSESERAQKYTTNSKGSSALNISMPYTAPTQLTSNVLPSVGTNSQILPVVTGSGDHTQLPHSKSMENMQKLLDILQEKADILYELLQDSVNATRVKLLKYLEQTRGVLVLETAVDDGFEIVVICTTSQQFSDLKRDFKSGKINQDFEERIVNQDVLKHMEVQGLKLKTIINEEDLEFAEQEFS